MPNAVKVDIVSKYLYRDIGLNLLGQHMGNQRFIYSLYRNLKPRSYIADQPDMFIIEEGAYVEEALLIQSGILEVGFTRLAHFKVSQSPFIFAYRQKGYQSILDYQLFTNQRSDFVYRAAKDIHGFAMDRAFIYQEVLKDLRLNASLLEMQSTSLVNY